MESEEFLFKGVKITVGCVLLGILQPKGET